MHPGEFSQPIRGQLITVSRSPNWEHVPAYEALSYVWGDNSEGYSIDIDGRAHPIAQNLECALRHLRSEKEARTLWIDAICINQRDNAEKSVQVGVMGEIYHFAVQVNIWLGPATPDSAMGMDVLEYLAGGTDPKSRPPWQENPPSLVLAGLKDIMSREWWSRTWTVQEIALAKRIRVVCGDRLLKLPSFYDDQPLGLKMFLRNLKFAEISPSWEQCGLTAVNMGSLTQLLSLKEDENYSFSLPVPDLLDIAHNLRHRKSLDRRDKIFALLGLGSAEWAEMKADYGLSVEETFQLFKRKMSGGYPLLEGL